jgi:hypothetical protein
VHLADNDQLSTTSGETNGRHCGGFVLDYYAIARDDTRHSNQGFKEEQLSGTGVSPHAGPAPTVRRVSAPPGTATVPLLGLFAASPDGQCRDQRSFS